MANRVSFDRINVDEHLNYSYIGYEDVKLTEFETTNTPSIVAGSMIEVNGSLYEFTTNESILNYEAKKTAYPFAIVIIENGATAHAEAVNIQPIWNPEKNGLYIDDSSRVISYGFDVTTTDAQLTSADSTDPYYEAGSMFMYNNDAVILEGRYASEIPGYYRAVRFDGISFNVKDYWNLPTERITENYEDEYYAGAQEPNGQRIAMITGDYPSDYFLEVWSGWKGSLQHRIQISVYKSRRNNLYWDDNGLLHAICAYYDNGYSKYYVRELVINPNTGATVTNRYVQTDQARDFMDYNDSKLYGVDMYDYILHELNTTDFSIVNTIGTLAAPPFTNTVFNSLSHNDIGLSYKWRANSGTDTRIEGYRPGDLNVEKFYIHKNMKIYPNGNIELFRRESIYENANGSINGIYEVSGGQNGSIYISTSGTLAYDEMPRWSSATDVFLSGNLPPLGRGERGFYYLSGETQGTELVISSYTPIADLPSFRGFTDTGRVTANDDPNLAGAWISWGSYSLRGNTNGMASEVDGVTIVGTLNPDYTFWLPGGEIIVDSYTNPGPSGYWIGIVTVKGSSPFTYHSISISSSHGDAPNLDGMAPSLSGSISGIPQNTNVKIIGTYDAGQSYPSFDGNIDVDSWENV